ncbi:GntP family permease [Nakamurella endophytica]|uniref:Gluconate transporter n=1 Tax=Nakamurella endophytica TaxID=1748367 RepID=A0A917SN40_9ACTN|nr:SLC13 family permease [Nakamurella endophytica]GGL86906.1 hypothetical protein GCM10011594_03160 [Nakamurella endophytica]
MHIATTAVLLAADEPKPSGSTAQLIIAAVVGIVVIVVLITWLKLHPFLALALGAVGIGIGAGLPAAGAVTSFGNGFGSTLGSVGVLIGLGAMYGKLLADSGGADRIVDTLVSRSGPRSLPWTMALVGAIIGLPMFFEIGLVLLIPVVVLVARRASIPLMRVAIPTLAGLSVMHGLVPPHPGPLTAVTALNANLGLTLALGVLIAVPTAIIAGPLFSKLAARWVDVPAPELFQAESAEQERHELGDGSGDAELRGGGTRTLTRPGARASAATTRPRTGPGGAGGGMPARGGATPARAGTAGGAAADRPRPTFLAALVSILLPVVLMLAKAVADVVAPKSTGTVKSVVDFLGTPVVALAIAVLAGIALLGLPARMDRARIATTLEHSLPPIAGIIFIVGAGGGLKQVLVDTGISSVIADAAAGSKLSVLFLAWLVAVAIRIATGSATVATVTAAGILAPVAADLSSSHVALMVLAIGAGSLFLSHVNDAGFWLVKQYLGLSVGQNLKTWTVMECVISVCGLVGVLLLSLVL